MGPAVLSGMVIYARARLILSLSLERPRYCSRLTKGCAVLANLDLNDLFTGRNSTAVGGLTFDIPPLPIDLHVGFWVMCFGAIFSWIGLRSHHSPPVRRLSIPFSWPPLCFVAFVGWLSKSSVNECRLHHGVFLAGLPFSAWRRGTCLFHLVLQVSIVFVLCTLFCPAHIPAQQYVLPRTFTAVSAV